MKKIFFSLLCLLNVASCSNTPNAIIIAPVINQQFNPIYSANNLSAHIQVQDLRANRHVMQIIKENDVATLINTRNDLSNEVKNSFTQILTQQGLSINENAATINIYIDKALINVQQSLLDYQASNEMVIRIALNNTKKKFIKTFRMHGKSNGPLKADIAVLERNFNQELSKLITQICNDNEVQQYIKNLS